MEKTKILIGVLLTVVLLAGVVMAHENFEEAKQLIDSSLSCDELSDEQLEEIGEYLMEQMHPGESHEAMDEMMGGEGSESLRLMHTNMAKMMYCNEGEGMNNMMNMMSGGMMNGMMGSGMGGMGGMMNSGNMMSGGMMGSKEYTYWNFVNVLYIALLIGLVILVYFLIIKVWRK